MKLFAIFLLGLLIPCASGQYISSTDDNGFRPYSSVDIDKFLTVNLATLRLQLHIPMASLPQVGGKLSTNYDWNYVSNSFTYSYVPCVEDDGYDPYTGACNTKGFYQFAQASGGAAITNDIYLQPNGSGLSTLDGQNISMYSPDGIHYYSVDGSGYRMDYNSAYCTGTQGLTIYKRDGTKYVWPSCYGPTQGAYIQDSNGNRMNYVPGANQWSASTAFTDTMGRTLPTFLAPNWTSTTDFSGCTGQFPISSAVTFSFPGEGGRPLTYKMCYAASPWGHYNANCDDNAVQAPAPDFDIQNCPGTFQIPATAVGPQSLVLPNGTAYTFEYDTYNASGSTESFGDLTKLTLPTGGTITFQWQNSIESEGNIVPGFSFSRVLASRSMDANDGTGPHTWHYVQSNGVPAGLTPPAQSGTTISQGYSVIVTDPDLNDTVHSFGGPGAYEESTLYYSGSYSAGVLLKGVRTDYDWNHLPGLGSNANAHPIRVTTYFPNGDTSVTESDVDPGIVFTANQYGSLSGSYGNASFGNVTQTRHWDYGSGGAGALLAVDTSHYLWKSNPAYLTANILDSVDAECVTPSVISTCQSGGAGSFSSSNYDEAGSPSGAHGNLTSRHTMLSASPLVMATSSSVFNQNGTIQSTTDANGNTTSFGYDSYGLYPAVVTHPSTNGVQHVDYYSHDPSTGVLVYHTDENGTYANDPSHTISATYDAFGRPLTISIPGGGGENYTYVDGIGASAAAVTLASPDPNRTETTLFDGLGRILDLERSVPTSDCTGGVVHQRSSYDNEGRLAMRTDSYCGSSGTGSYTHFDPLDRPHVVDLADGNHKTYTYQGGAVTDVLDENGSSHWLLTKDALGRLTKVIEPGSLETDYTYDALGNLWSVQQVGKPGVTPAGFSSPEVSKSRSFKYDSASRLLWSQNPETGLVCYGQGDGTIAGCQANGYDANGNLVYKTDANGVVMHYSYDALNRILTKTSPTNDVEENYGYTYDQCLNGVGLLCTVTQTNPTVQLNGAALQMNQTQFAYDKMGRVTNEDWFDYMGQAARTGVAAVYDLAGNVNQLTYPDQTVVSQQWDTGGHLSGVYSGPYQSPGAAYVSGMQYTPSGAMASATYGNGVTLQNLYNNRLQPCREMASSSLLPPITGGGNLLDRQLFYAQVPESNCGNASGNNGNIWSTLQGPVVTGTSAPGEVFHYDALKRLTQASSFNRPAASTYSFVYNYDSFGNMLPADQLHTSLNYGIDAATNRLSLNGDVNTGDLRYYPDGSLSHSPDGVGGQHTFSYNAEGFLRYIDAAAVGNYQTNGLGERTFAGHNNTTWNEYVYFNGQPMADLDNDGKWSNHIYANGQKVAKVESNVRLWHVHGTPTTQQPSGCGAVWYLNNPSSNLSTYTIQNGDKLVADVRTSASAQALFGLYLSQSGTYYGSWINSDEVTNQPMYSYEQSDGLFHHTITDLSNYAGGTMLSVWVGSQTNTADWDIWLSNVVILRADGSPIPIFTGQDISGTIVASCNESNLDFSTQSLSTGDVAVTTTYYLTDQVGTTSEELSSGGWPIWQGYFTPFGQEIVNGGEQTVVGAVSPDGTTNRYKFTGKERDDESGLDYFGARYYGSSMGRFLSPDWAAKAEPVPYAKLDNPQSLNLYSYVGNNPLARFDADGHQDTTDGAGPPGDGDGDRIIDPCKDSSQCKAQRRAEQQAQQHTASVVFGETSGLTSEVDQNGKPVTTPGADPNLATARENVADVSKRNKAVYSRKPTKAELKNPQVKAAWEASQAAARNSKGNLPGKYFFLRQDGANNPQRPSKAAGYGQGTPIRTYGPFRNAGGGDVPAGDKTYIDIYDK